ncbi:hypothetical protein [uncultured Desulfosarcina sp.]|uniref:hypothetical protein n=1 Tax=uncultured Desulfosarcina sp. TaxID=218289 RepID=UPI0029C8E1DD|nr:hypothetical protein [uncultured Desulfosarcina sp.]
MDGRQKPDPQPENENELNDEQAIDLTQIVEGGDNGDIIDLTEILEEPEQALDDGVEPEEAIIPLVDTIPANTSTELPEDTDDEIIDLTAVAAAPETPAVKTAAEPAPMPDEDDGDEEVIDLMDVATTLETDLTEAEPEAPATISEESVSKTEDDDEVIDLMDVATTLETDLTETEPEVSATISEESIATAEDEDDVIDLMDVANTPETDTADTERQGHGTISEETTGITEADEPIIDLLDAVEPPPEEAETAVDADDELTDLETRAQAILTDATDAFDYETPEEAAETAGPDSDFMVFEDDGTITDESETPAIVDNEPKIPEPVTDDMLFVPVSPSEPISLTEAQLEAALERTVEKIYGEKIEQLMIRAIEKTVTREIARIKNALLEDDDDMVG